MRDHLRGVRTFGGTSKDGYVGVDALESPDRMLGHVSPQPPDERSLIGQVRVGWYSSVRSHTFRTPATDAPRQLLSGVIDGGRVAWRETRSTRLDIEDWWIFTADVATGAVTTVANSDTYYGTTEPPAFNDDDQSIALVGDTVYWSVADWPTNTPQAPPTHGGSRPDEITHRLLAAPAGGGQPRSVAEGAVFPASTGESLVFMQDERLGAHVPAGSSRIQRLGRDGRVSTVASVAKGSVRALCGTPDYIAWAVYDTTWRGSIYVQEKGTDRAVRIRRKQSLARVHLGCGTGFVAWGADGRNVLHDFASGRQHTLGTTRGVAEVKAHGTTIAWTSQLGPDGKPGPWRIGSWRP